MELRVMKRTETKTDEVDKESTVKYSFILESNEGDKVTISSDEDKFKKNDLLQLKKMESQKELKGDKK